MALRESSSFKNGMELRGVKVLGYSSDAGGEPSAKLQWQSATAAKDGGVANSCKAPAASRLSHLIGWQWNTASRFGADDLALLNDLREKWQTQWDAFSALTPLWRLVPYKRPPLPATPTSRPCWAHPSMNYPGTSNSASRPGL